MMRKTCLALLMVYLSGCVLSSAPDDNAEFYKISRLSELAGVYQNKGNPSGYLSQKIWPDISEIFPDMEEIKTFDTGHEAIELIEVIPKDDSLVVKAIRNGCSVYEKSYVLGRDFDISRGKVVIHREAHLLSRGSGDVLAGPSYEDVTLGIDTGKQGKSRSKSYAAGLVFMVMPVAISETSDIRYERVIDDPQNFPACIGRCPIDAWVGKVPPLRSDEECDNQWRGKCSCPKHSLAHYRFISYSSYYRRFLPQIIFFCRIEEPCRSRSPQIGNLG